MSVELAEIPVQDDLKFLRFELEIPTSANMVINIGLPETTFLLHDYIDAATNMAGLRGLINQPGSKWLWDALKKQLTLAAEDCRRGFEAALNKNEPTFQWVLPLKPSVEIHDATLAAKITYNREDEKAWNSVATLRFTLDEIFDFRLRRRKQKELRRIVVETLNKAVSL